ncbi:MAG: flagellar basal body P-ring protein FlgI [Methyloversatilis sp.]|jgi:flagellar P-ring protein precursor FlgI|nr:flagellar basal body P-ring protein FlgI [Methyloversatilis sp.]
MKIIWTMLLLCACNAFAEDMVRLKDLGRLDGWRENHLVGFGVVTGLAGTGDSPRSKATRQSVANLLSNFDMTITADQINSRNVAIVSVMAALPPVTRRGDRVDVVVTSLGDARSLVGGTLLLAPLKGPDARVYALAQGPISIGGYRYDQNGNVAQKNHPTVGSIPGGAQVEAEVLADSLRSDGSFDFVLGQPDHTTAQRIAAIVNTSFGMGIAEVRDSGAIRIHPSAALTGDLPAFLARLENLEVAPDVRARVVINERTGIIVSGGDVRISKVTVAHSDLKVSVVTDFAVSQPIVVGRPGPGLRTTVIPNTRINVDEGVGGVVEIPTRSSVAELVSALNRINASTRDIIAILQGIKAAGALHAELIIQ